MKRVLTTSVVAGLLGTLGLAPAVSAEATLYGSVRSGIYMKDSQESGVDTQWDIGEGGVGGDNFSSHIGVKASHELDGGMMAGLHIEKGLDGFSTRHQNVWLSGAFGKLTFGQQGSAYQSATTWDGTNQFGDKTRQGKIGAGSRVSGIKYSSSFGGPFSLEAMILDSATGEYADRDGVNAAQLAGTLTTDVVTLSAGYLSVGKEAGGVVADAGGEEVPWSGDVFGGSASGAIAGLDWDVGFEMGDADDNYSDGERYGFTLGYTVSNTRAYIFYEDFQGGKNENKVEKSFTVFGLSHTLAPGVDIVAEYSSPSEDEDPKEGAIMVRVDF